MKKNTAADFFKYVDSVFFNIFSQVPPDPIAGFLNKYSTLLVKASRHKGGWTMYPPGTEKPKLIRHSLQFNDHPFFSFDFLEGNLEIESLECKEYFNTNDINIRLTFQSKKDAFSAFNSISSTLEAFKPNKREQTVKGIYKAEFSIQNRSRGISLLLAKDNFHQGRHTLIIYPETSRFYFPLK